jgi:hypothetical protein
MTFTQYLNNFEYDKLQHPTLKCHGQDDLGNFIYKNNKLTRFRNFHFTHNTKWFFDLLLQNVSFQNESELFSASNFEKKLCMWMLHSPISTIGQLTNIPNEIHP